MIRQVDAAIKSDLSTVTVNGSSVPVVIGGSKEFAASGRYPAIGFQLLTVVRDKSRESQQNPFKKDRDAGTITYRAAVKCYNLVYQIEYEAKYPQDDRELLEKLSVILDRGFIMAEDPRDPPNTQSLTTENQGLAHLDYTESEGPETVIYRKAWTYIVMTAFDEETDQEFADIATGVEFEVGDRDEFS